MNDAAFFHHHTGCLDAEGRCHAFCQTFTVEVDGQPDAEYDTCPDREAHAAWIWAALESQPGFNEELEQGLADMRAGLGRPWAEIRREL